MVEPVFRCQKCAYLSDSLKNVAAVLGPEVASTRVGGRSEGFGLAMPEIALMFRDLAHLAPTTWGEVVPWWGRTVADPQFVGLSSENDASDLRKCMCLQHLHDLRGHQRDPAFDHRARDLRRAYPLGERSSDSGQERPPVARNGSSCERVGSNHPWPVR